MGWGEGSRASVLEIGLWSKTFWFWHQVLGPAGCVPHPFRFPSSPPTPISSSEMLYPPHCVKMIKWIYVYEVVRELLGSKCALLSKISETSTEIK